MRAMKELTSDKKMLEYGIMKPYSNISCFSTTRHGGCSEGNYATMNCTYYCGDDIMNVQKTSGKRTSLLIIKGFRLMRSPINARNVGRPLNMVHD